MRLAGPCRLSADRQRANHLGNPQNWVACPTLIGDGSIAYLATRKTNDSTWQFGAHGFGLQADTLTRTMDDLIRIWDRDYRHGPGPRITVHPSPALPLTRHPRLGVQRRHHYRRHLATTALTQ